MIYFLTAYVQISMSTKYNFNFLNYFDFDFFEVRT